MPRRPGPPSGRGRRNTTNRPARWRLALPSPAADVPGPERPRPPWSARKSRRRRSRRAFGKPNPPLGPADTRLLPVVRRSQTPASLAPPPVDHLASLPRRHPLAETVRSLAPRSVRLVGSFHGSTSNNRPEPRRTRAGDITGSREITRRDPTVSSARCLSPAPFTRWTTRPDTKPGARRLDASGRRLRNAAISENYNLWTVIEYAVGSTAVARTRRK